MLRRKPSIWLRRKVHFACILESLHQQGYDVNQRISYVVNHQKSINRGRIQPHLASFLPPIRGDDWNITPNLSQSLLHGDPGVLCSLYLFPLAVYINLREGIRIFTISFPPLVRSVALLRRNRILVISGLYDEEDEEDGELLDLPTFPATNEFTSDSEQVEENIDIVEEKEEVFMKDVEMDENHNIDHSGTKEALQWSLTKDPFLVIMELNDQSSFLLHTIPSFISNEVLSIMEWDLRSTRLVFMWLSAITGDAHGRGLMLLEEADLEHGLEHAFSLKNGANFNFFDMFILTELGMNLADVHYYLNSIVRKNSSIGARDTGFGRGNQENEGSQGKHDGRSRHRYSHYRAIPNVDSSKPGTGMVKAKFGVMMEKDIEDMTIAEYMEYEAEMNKKTWLENASRCLLL
ncbi:hypothetical protein Tco_0731794 [Tanacetum coccineum]